MANNPAYHSKTKHIDVQYHFMRDMIEEKKVLLVKVDTLKNTTDALTKSVSSEKFSWCKETMGIAGLDKRISSLVAPLWKENNKWENVGLCYILSTTNPRS